MKRCQQSCCCKKSSGWDGYQSRSLGKTQPATTENHWITNQWNTERDLGKSLSVINKTHSVRHSSKGPSLEIHLCLCVCVCVCARARVCACFCPTVKAEGINCKCQPREQRDCLKQWLSKAICIRIIWWAKSVELPLPTHPFLISQVWVGPENLHFSGVPARFVAGGLEPHFKNHSPKGLQSRG